MAQRTVHEFPETHTPALYALMLLNVAVFVLWQVAYTTGGLLLDFMQATFLVSADHLDAGLFWTLLTSEFSHVSPIHLAFNLFAIWMFGQKLERVLGARGLLHLYIAGAIAASLGHVAYDWTTPSTVPALGASGAAMAIAITWSLTYPKRMLYVFGVVPVRAWVAAVGFVMIDLLGLISPISDGIAHAAHLGGALYGWFYTRTWLITYLRERLRTVPLVRRVVRAPDPWD